MGNIWAYSPPQSFTGRLPNWFIYMHLWRRLSIAQASLASALALHKRWIYVLKHMEALNRLPWTAKDPIFERLAQISEISALTRDERIKYDAAIRYYRDNAHALEDAEEVGERKGWKRGHAAGVQQGIIETAKKLKAMGMGAKDIHIATGLSPEDIEKL